MNIIQLQPKLIKFTEEIARQLLPKFQTQEELDKLLEHHHISAKSSITKSEIAGWYGVHRMTFNKWIKGFGKPIFPNYTLYLKRKHLYVSEVLWIMKTLGYEGQVYRKKELLELLETDYRTMQDNIRTFPQIYGISTTVYNSLSKFPPNIGQRIVAGLWLE